jgi:hypothetical protein
MLGSRGGPDHNLMTRTAARPEEEEVGELVEAITAAS